jgi:multisubunit Na+/H+ antiporter MnhB subunit
MNSDTDRAERFAAEIEGLNIKDQSNRTPVVWLRLSFVGMLLAVGTSTVAFFMSHSTKDALVQRDAIVLALTGVSLGVVCGAIYLRFALTNFLRFWLARQSFDLQHQTNSLAAQLADRNS